MERPYIFCHMMTSLDGKIMGNYMTTKNSEKAGEVFYNIAFGEHPYYEHRGWLSGRVTTDDNFTFYKKPKLDESAPKVPEGDYIVAPDLPMYYVSVDPSGKLGWESNEVIYQDTKAHVPEVLTEKASNAYKAFLRKRGISYIICGKEGLDYALVLKKIKEIFGIKTLMLGGGGVLNWSFIQAGMCDELSIVMAASADGSSKTPTLFECGEGFGRDRAIDFKLLDVQRKEGDSLWLRYKVLYDEN